MKKILIRISLALFVLGGIALFVAVNYYDIIPIEQSVCKANESDLQVPMGEYIDEFRGKSILEFPSQEYLEKVFTNYPQIEKATVHKTAAGSIKVNYDLKKPCILVNLDKVYGLTWRGELVPAGAGDYPIVTGLKIRKPILYYRQPNQSIGYVLKLAELIYDSGDTVMNKISTINLADDSGLSIFLDGCPAKLILGRGEEALKLKKISHLADFLFALDDDVVAVDMRFDNQIILRKDN